jgi:hypothetical protein
VFKHCLQWAAVRGLHLPSSVPEAVGRRLVVEGGQGVTEVCGEQVGATGGPLGPPGEGAEEGALHGGQVMQGSGKDVCRERGEGQGARNSISRGGLLLKQSLAGSRCSQLT